MSKSNPIIAGSFAVSGVLVGALVAGTLAPALAGTFAGGLAVNIASSYMGIQAADALFGNRQDKRESNSAAAVGAVAGLMAAGPIAEAGFKQANPEFSGILENLATTSESILADGGSTQAVESAMTEAFSSMSTEMMVQGALTAIGFGLGGMLVGAMIGVAISDPLMRGVKSLLGMQPSLGYAR